MLDVSSFKAPFSGSGGAVMNEQEPTKISPRDSIEPKPFMLWLGFGICAKCLAVSILMVLLLLSVLFTLLKVPVGIEPFTLGGSLALLYHAAILPVLSLIGEMLKSLSPWGVIALALLVFITRGPAWIRESLSSGRWEIGGFKFDGTSSSAFKKELGEAARIVEKANKEISEAYESAKSYASQLRDGHQIGALTSKLAVDVAEIIGPICPSDYRLTLYVPDFVFSDRLYQFTEYYDKRGEQISEGKAGRTFSVRYGIIGRVWRSGVAEIEGELISKHERDELQKDQSPGRVEKFIARRWGLNLEEAVRVQEYNSYGAIRLNIADKSVGVVFFDSKGTSAFGDSEKSKDTLEKIEAVLTKSRLMRKLLEISHEVAPWSGRIEIFRNS
jgi:hypothetical protein